MESIDDQEGRPVSGISTDNIMAMRGAILQRNAALHDVAGTPGLGRNAGGSGFEAAMNSVLSKAREPASADGRSTIASTGSMEAPRSDFFSSFNTALQKVNQLGEQEDAATEAFEKGETTDIAQVMLIGQKSSIAFEATLQIRNKLLSAYKDIMNMPV